jgi:hypothetical protein
MGSVFVGEVTPLPALSEEIGIARDRWRALVAEWGGHGHALVRSPVLLGAASLMSRRWARIEQLIAPANWHISSGGTLSV